MKMKKIFYTCGAILALFSHYLLAHSYKVGDVDIGHPWTFNTPPGAKVGSAFLTLTSGKTDDKLVRAESPIAGKTEIHTHVNENGVMRMRAISHIEIGAGKSVELKPGGFHIMLFDLKQPIIKGEKFPITLTFEKAGQVQVEVAVEDRSAAKHSDHAGHKH